MGEEAEAQRDIKSRPKGKEVGRSEDEGIKMR